jgi:hypothetical protein
MALVLADRVRETTTTTGTGTISLGGPVSGFEGFGTAIGNANTTYYAIVDAATGAWEVGLGTYTSSGSTLARTTILSSSNAGSAVNFAAGTKDVFVTQPAERALYLNGAGTGVDAGAAAFTANGVVYASSTSALATGSALEFDGTNFTAPRTQITTAGSPPASGAGLEILGGTSPLLFAYNRGTSAYLPLNATASAFGWSISGTDAMVLTSSGLEIKQSQLIGYSSYAGIGTNGLAVAGNVGVGTASPVGKLSVVGDILAPSFNTNTTYTIGIQDAQVNSFVSTKRGSLKIQASSAIAGGDGMGAGDLTLKAGDSFFGGAGVDGDVNIIAGRNTLSSTFSTGAVKFTTNNAERMRLDSAGNLGLGVTPSAWSSAFKALQISSTVISNNGAADSFFGANYFFDGSNNRYLSAAHAAAYGQVEIGRAHV